MQNKILCTLMRSGTSKGPFIDLRDLPTDLRERDKVLMRIMGAPDKQEIDGLGGGAFVTSKVAMVQPSDRKGIDVDYLFAQVIMDKPIVDTSPTCGNMITGVGPFAIEKGWVKAVHPETTVKVYNYNTDSRIDIKVQTPSGAINYSEGDTMIDGVPGTAAPIKLIFYNIAGGATGNLFPTGQQREKINKIDVSIVDAGNLMMLVKAKDIGLTGTEGHEFFESNTDLMHRIETMRLEAGRRAGIKDVPNKVIPKVGILSTPSMKGTIKSQYLTPHSLHPSHALTGAVCIGTAIKAGYTVASDLAEVDSEAQETTIIEHVKGVLPVVINATGHRDTFTLVSAGTLRTARKIMDGFVYY